MGAIGVTGILFLFFLMTGFLACFFGYRLFRVVLTMLGFVSGAIFAGTLVWSFFTQNQLIILVGGLAGGIVGAALLSLFYFFGIFITGALFGLLIASLITSQTAVEPAIIVPIVGVIFGLTALALQKYVIIVSTAVGGAWMLVSALVPILRGTPLTTSWEVWSHHSPPALLGVIAWIVLSLLGLFFQLKSSDKKKERKVKRDRER